MHHSIPEQGKWLRQVVGGFFAYHAVPTNSKSLNAFRHHVVNLWRRTLRYRSQKDRTRWDRIAPSRCMVATTPCPSSMAWNSLRRQLPKVGARCVNYARRDLCGGLSVMGVPTAIGFLKSDFQISSTIDYYALEKATDGHGFAPPVFSSGS